MLLVIDVIGDYCQSKNLPFPSDKEVSSIGTKTRDRFNFIYMQKSGIRGHIEGTGFVRVKEGKFAMIVNGYPDDFRDEMYWVIEKFLTDKQAKIDKAELEKKRVAEIVAKPKRPRIPANRPVYSRK